MSEKGIFCTKTELLNFIGNFFLKKYAILRATVNLGGLVSSQDKLVNFHAVTLT